MASDGMLEGLAQQRQSLLRNIFSATIKPQLVIWPEVSLAKYEFRKKDNISQQAAHYGVSMLVASPDQSPSGQTYNSIFSISSSGSILNRYNKNILIPFIESKSPGKETWALHDKLPGRPGSIICYESVFPHPAALLSAAGAGFISLSTNDAYAGPSILPALHLQFSRIRAVETGKTIVRAANAGPSAVITADGKIDQHLELYKSGIIHARIQPDYSMTFFVKHYHSIFIILWLLASLAVIIFIITLARLLQFNLPGQSIAISHVVISTTLLCCVLLFQYFYMRHIYQTNSGRNVPAGFVNFQQGHIADALPYEKLKVNTPGDSLLSAITYLLRDFGNDVTLDRIRGVLNSISEDYKETSKVIEINAIIDRFDYTTGSEEHPNLLKVFPKHIKTPCLALLTTGETVVISEFSDAGVIFFSPYYGEMLAIKTTAFMQKWTGKTLTLSTRRRPWDI
jgi:predicted amidohydrolase